MESNSKEIIRRSMIDSCITYIIVAYNEIIATGMLVRKKPLEDIRRNQIYNFMIKNKRKYRFSNTITTESGSIDEETLKTIGRIDISIYNKGYEQHYISFECKRFIKGNISPKKLEKAYFIDGLSRYTEGKYSCELGYGGMIAFLEEGDLKKLNINIQNLFGKYCIGDYIDESSYYNHQYVYSTKIFDHNNNIVEIKHLIMAFS